MAEVTEMAGYYVICKQPINSETSPGATLSEKGSSTINRASEARIDTSTKNVGKSTATHSK